MGSRVLTACSFRSKSIPQQVFHRCRSAEALRLFRVPAVYLTSAFLWFFSILLFRRINNLRRINFPRGSTPTTGTIFPFVLNQVHLMKRTILNAPLCMGVLVTSLSAGSLATAAPQDAPERPALKA